ncbi:Tropinone reductase [Sesamum alatum]|uniref:Tropinone reductase n=1 Tax=Sesamum alatum TaxID=300844 RepID=A0AAE1XIU3_9LAMI|nr:Tropinone reductase [Sesamum alatum]
MESQKEMSRDEKWSLKGMTALVTGGTRGIGYAIVEELGGFGARIHTCSRNERELNERIQEWKGKGFEVSGSVCDLSSRRQREELMHTVASLFHGNLNILVNNAAISIMKRAIEHTEQDFWHIMGTNLESPYHLCQIAHPLLKASGKGNIVFISSVAGKMALPGLAWAKDNIRVNTVAPFAVNTTIMKPENVDKSIEMMYAPLLARTPIRPIAEADEISPLTAFLCLPAASHITGQVIYVDGGFTSTA